ncbi:PAS domain S-box protein [Scopulibacillus cellulosilyticus]|uniref:histidine kinase n=1 Tax=Scopulibacillus cellulosilyticus TaxID=2665665 RepID=A0ABW2Q3J3_9BACL
MEKFTEKSNRNILSQVPPKVQAKEEKEEETSYEKVNILIVDDHPENLLALEAVLKSENYYLVKANSGEEALKYVLKQDFAVILLDVQMPGLNGFETAKLIKKREKSKNIPIIFITAINQTIESVLQGYNVGAVDYIFKPFHPEKLKLKVREFVKIYQNMKLEKQHSQLKLKEMNERLNRTSFDLRKNEELAKVIGETLLDTIITLDREGYILSVNPSVNDTFGYSADELLGHHVIKLIPKFKYINGEQVSSMVDCLRRMKNRIVEREAVHKNGQKFPVDIQIGEAAIEEEHIFVCSIRDITERKEIEKERKHQYKLLEELVEERAQELVLTNKKLQNEIIERKKTAENLRISRELFYKIFQSSPCMIAIRSKKDGRYIDVNDSWLHFTGYSYDDVKDQTSHILHIKEESDHEPQSSGSLDTKESIRNKKIHYLTKNGEAKDGLLSTEAIEIDGEECVLSTITDITERMRLEKEMARLDRLNLIGEMAAGIAHEIRNPMTTVRGFLELSKSDPEHVSIQYIDLMLEELKRANSIISEFLNLAKNKATNKTPHQLNLIVKALYPLIQAEAVLSDMSVVLDLGKCPELYLDEKEIRQLILNLSINGLESMSSGGRLTIKTYTEGHTVTLEIRDQGCGIEHELIEKIGTPFFTTKERGTGLGLAICYSVASRHHAVIDLETSKQGTAFFIRFNNIVKK